MSLPPRYQSLVDPIIADAVRRLADGLGVTTAAFIGCLGQGDPLRIAIDASSDAAKATAAHTIRQAAAVMRADYVFTLLDTWLLPARDAHRYTEILSKYGSLSQAPMRVEALAMQLETHVGVWAAMPIIQLAAPSKKKRRLAGEVCFSRYDAAQGRFSNLLPVQSASNSTLQ